MLSDIFSAIFLGLIEGLTEFLPISSTGHLIIAEQYFPIKNLPVSSFLVIIQMGAVLAVAIIYWKKLFPGNFNNLKNHWKKIIIGAIPAFIIGFLLGDIIDRYFFNPKTVAFGLILGSILLFIANRKIKKTNIVHQEIDNKKALLIGLFQTIALIPGVSRSGASISGALLLGIKKQESVEFSFFLAIPVIFGAGLYSLIKNPTILTASNLGVLLTGLLISFLSAILAIKFFIKFTEKKDLSWFIVYRLLLAIIIFLIF